MLCVQSSSSGIIPPGSFIYPIITSLSIDFIIPVPKEISRHAELTLFILSVLRRTLLSFHVLIQFNICLSLLCIIHLFCFMQTNASNLFNYAPSLFVLSKIKYFYFLITYSIHFTFWVSKFQDQALDLSNFLTFQAQTFNF